MSDCHRLEQKITYQRRMALALFIPVFALVALIAAHRFFTANKALARVGSEGQDSSGQIIRLGISQPDLTKPEIPRSATNKSGICLRRVRSFPAFGQHYTIIPDQILQSEQPSGSPLKVKRFYPIYTTASLAHTVGNALSGRYVAGAPPPPILPPATFPWDQSRPPSVKTRTEPDGIYNTVTLTVVIDTLGNMAPFNYANSKLKNGVYYKLQRGSPRDAETIFTSLQHWTFSPALDTHGNPVQAALTITHIPRSR